MKRHSKIAKSNRHKKFKSVNNYSEDDFNDHKLKISEQTIPRKWEQIIESKKLLKQKSKQKKKKKNNCQLICVRTESEPIEKGMTRSDKQLPEVIEQGLYESQYHFMSRLSKLSAKARAEANIEDRFDVDFCQKLDTNDQKSEESLKTKQKSNKQLKQKLKQLKKKEKKRHKRPKEDSFGHLRDEVMFGERVNEPPLLSHSNLKRIPIKQK